MTLVLLLKTEKPNDSFKKALEENGYRAHCISALEFCYINLEELAEQLNSPEEFSGIIFTSQNAVEACAKAQSASKRDLIGKWKDKFNYVVGEATYTKAKETLGLDCKGASSGNAGKLVGQIVSDLKPEETGKFLYPKTSLKTIDLAGRLAQEGFVSQEIEVYNTLPAADFCANVQSYKNNLGNADFVVFFSPSGVEHFFSYIQMIFEKTSKIIAIGPSTSEKLLQCQAADHYVLESPNADSLIKCLHDNISAVNKHQQ
ncbi:hypothetical protein EB796_023562 [Bugula neritina]|uniref:Uroporphyrinogen-III synthase n=1 Tax=Bugula neritina TaxID=10212 RepID=A0A7J7IX83_BUGNE|nr:hypothetical protein EB796_023562 [Bugula neritina]